MLSSAAATEPKKNISFIQQDIIDKKASPKPVALTEYNMDGNSAGASASLSYINGIQATILFNELIKNNFGLAARWLLASGDAGMFYQGDNSSLLWQPRPDFYYAYYQQKFTGDYVIPATSNNAGILAYASRFSSGETGVVIVNKGKTAQVVKIDPTNIGVGDQYYCYSLTGGSDNGDFSQFVSVNGVGPTGTQWGPRESLETIPANAFSIDGTIKLDVPARSVQFVMIQGGNNQLTVTAVPGELKTELGLTNYPNPFSGSTTIQFQTSSAASVALDVFDYMGGKISTLVDKDLPPGTHRFDFNGNLLPAGLYFCRLKVGNFLTTRKMILAR